MTGSDAICCGCCGCSGCSGCCVQVRLRVPTGQRSLLAPPLSLSLSLSPVASYSVQPTPYSFPTTTTVLPPQAQPLCPLPDKTRSQTKGFLIPNGTRIHFSIILPDLPSLPVFHALHREIALLGTGTPTVAPVALSPQSSVLTSFSRIAFLVERLPPCQPRHAGQVGRCQC
jgi:hypothetical protein